MAVSNPPSMSSIISEFGTNGSPTNLYAYRRGGGIIGDSFSGIGLGTVGSPLKLSQFAGLSNYLDIQYITTSEYFYFDWSLAYFVYGYSDGTSGLEGSLGSITDGTSNIYGGTKINFIGYNDGNNIFALVMDGYQANAGWTSMELNGVTYYRDQATWQYWMQAAYVYQDKTSWWWPYQGGIPTYQPGVITEVKWK